MHQISFLPLRQGDDIARAIYLCELQPLLRQAEDLAGRPDAAALWIELLDTQRARAWADVVQLPGWAHPAECTDEEAVAYLTATLTAAVPSDLVTARLVARTAALLLLLDTARSTDDPGTHADPAAFIRALLMAYPVGDRPGLELVWPIGTTREARWDAAVLPADDPKVRDAAAGFGHPPCVLAAVLENEEAATQIMANKVMNGREASVVMLIGDDRATIMRVGRVSALRDLMHLFGYNLAQHDERQAMGVTFSQLVQQQQLLYGSLDAKGIRIDMSEPIDARTIPAGCAADQAFHIGMHDTLLEHMREVQQAAKDERLVNYGMHVLQRLRGKIAALQAQIPGLPERWWPDASALRRSPAEADSHFLGYAEHDGKMAPALVRMRVAVMKDAHAERAAMH